MSQTLPNPPWQRAAGTRASVWPLLRAGLYPIPVHPETRKPYKGFPWGELDRLGYRPGVGEAITGTLDGGPPDPWVAMAFEWWDRWPLAGAAILTGRSKLLVVDVDPRNGGHHSLARLVRQGPLPDTRMVRTRHGGIHLYYRVDRPVRGRPRLLGPGLDVKSFRGLAVCPPTPGYELVQRRPIAPAPAWLLNRCGTGTGTRRRREAAAATLDDPRARATLDRAIAAITDAPPGLRHDTVCRQAARVFAIVDDDQAEAELVAAARRRARSARDRCDGERAVRDQRAWARTRGRRSA
jgi:hypothetical protein